MTWDKSLITVAFGGYQLMSTVEAALPWRAREAARAAIKVALGLERIAKVSWRMKQYNDMAPSARMSLVIERKRQGLVLGLLGSASILISLKALSTPGVDGCTHFRTIPTRGTRHEEEAILWPVNTSHFASFGADVRSGIGRRLFEKEERAQFEVGHCTCWNLASDMAGSVLDIQHPSSYLPRNNIYSTCAQIKGCNIVEELTALLLRNPNIHWLLSSERNWRATDQRLQKQSVHFQPPTPLRTTKLLQRKQFSSYQFKHRSESSA